MKYDHDRIDMEWPTCPWCGEVFPYKKTGKIKCSNCRRSFNVVFLGYANFKDFEEINPENQNNTVLNQKVKK